MVDKIKYDDRIVLYRTVRYRTIILRHGGKMEHSKAIGFDVKRLNNIIMRNVQMRLVQEGYDEVTVMHGWILGYLFNNKSQPICQKDIEEQFGIAKSTVTNILQLMERKGYVVRQSDEIDARIKRITLTEDGERTHIAIVKIIDKFHSDMEQDLTTEDRNNFYAVFDKILNRLDMKESEND